MPKPTKYKEKDIVYFWDKDKEDALYGIVERIYIYKDTNIYILSTKDKPVTYDADGMHCGYVRDEWRLFPSRSECLENQLEENEKHINKLKQELYEANVQAEYLGYLLYCEEERNKLK